MAYNTDIEASCAICGAPAYPECPHEGDRLEIALNQAMQRWVGYNSIREWVVDKAREQVVKTFHNLRAIRIENHKIMLQQSPYYSLLHQYGGQPPLPPGQMQQFRADMHRMEQMLKADVDQAWRSSCLQYPQILDYYFNLVEFNFPRESDPMLRDPRFGPQKDGSMRQVKARRESVERDHRKKERRRSRGGTPPPIAPLPPHNHRR